MLCNRRLQATLRYLLTFFLSGLDACLTNNLKSQVVFWPASLMLAVLVGGLVKVIRSSYFSTIAALILTFPSVSLLSSQTTCLPGSVAQTFT